MTTLGCTCTFCTSLSQLQPWRHLNPVGVAGSSSTTVLYLSGILIKPSGLSYQINLLSFCTSTGRHNMKPSTHHSRSPSQGTVQFSRLLDAIQQSTIAISGTKIGWTSAETLPHLRLHKQPTRTINKQPTHSSICCIFLCVCCICSAY